MSPQCRHQRLVVSCQNSPMSAADSNLTPEIRDLLQKRYGIRPKSGKLPLWKLLAFTLAALFLPWLFWSAWHHSNPEIRFTLISFQNESDNSIDITFQIERRNPATPLRCTLLARDIDKNVVGEVDYSVAPSSKRSVTINTTIPTRIRPVNAAVLECYAAQG